MQLKHNKKICAVYREGAVTYRTCQRWLSKFSAGDFLLDDAPQSCRPVEVDNNHIDKTLTENNQCYTMQEIADTLKMSKSSNENHLHQLSYVNHFDVWVPHKISEKNLLDHIFPCDSLLTLNNNVLFLKQIVTGNDKSIIYNNVEQQRSWANKMNHQRPVFIQRR